MNNLDIDRLHAVIEGKLSGRRCGKTLSLHYRIAGQIALGNIKRIGYQADSMSFAIDFLMPELSKVLQDSGFSVVRKSYNVLEVNNVEIIFDRRFNFSRGCSNLYIIDELDE